jgi:hypothetical protein
MNAFSEYLREWQTFFATVATASATLTGLLFVSLSLNRARLRGVDGLRHMQMAKRTFGDFLYVLMIALVFLVPRQVPGGFALALVVLGLARGAGLLRQVAELRGGAARSPAIAEVLRAFGLPLIAVVGLLLVAVSALLGSGAGLYGLVAVVAALLATASWNAWLLLVQDDDVSGGGSEG